ncbi:endonuclease/exonuclease/phosphatase family protein [Streptomyces sp. NPDC020141]|uniref:endonuclease/exonuclease/phosphatase family protein n=1 Tax=Streptomyces sp. NPDC020141 TaxID=3365065 RepID=UPI00378E5698
MINKVTVACWNFEQNGKSNPALRRRAHERLARLNPHLVLRQEMWGADEDGSTVLYELEEVLGMRGWLGPHSCTAVFADQRVFRTMREWPRTGPMWVLPPTALTMRYLPAGEDAMPLVVASFHLNYASATNRLAETEWLTTWADKRWATPDGESVRMPALIGGDTNGYPEPGTTGDPALPVLENIQDEPHRAHRSYLDPGGARRMDTRPDNTLYTAGLRDVARYWASHHDGTPAAVAPTVDAYETHGPDARVDRVYATPELLPAVTDVEVLEVPTEISDHHIVRLTLDGPLLTDILNRNSDGLSGAHGATGIPEASCPGAG